MGASAKFSDKIFSLRRISSDESLAGFYFHIVQYVPYHSRGWGLKLVWQNLHLRLVDYRTLNCINLIRVQAAHDRLGRGSMRLHPGPPCVFQRSLALNVTSLALIAKAKKLSHAVAGRVAHECNSTRYNTRSGIHAARAH
jgi:hypothetical protein